MTASGLVDLVVLAINLDGDQYIEDVEEYDLPILQDTPEEDVTGQWDVRSYDTFIIDRDGQIAFPLPNTHPGWDEGHAALVEALSSFI